MVCCACDHENIRGSSLKGNICLLGRDTGVDDAFVVSQEESNDVSDNTITLEKRRVES